MLSMFVVVAVAVCFVRGVAAAIVNGDVVVAGVGVVLVAVAVVCVVVWCLLFCYLLCVACCMLCVAFR